MAGSLIGALRISLSAETSAFEAGMKKSQRTAAQTAKGIERSLGTLKAGVSGFAAAFSLGVLARGVRAALDYAGSLGEVSQQLGVTTKDLQVLRYAAGQVGVSQEGLETGLSKLTITLGKVAAGAEAPKKALKAIGVSVEELKGKDSGAAFRIIADGLEKVKDRSQRAAIEVALFGKSGAQLDTLLSGGSKQINQLADAAERLGIVISDEAIRNADDTADKLDAMKTVLSAQIAGVVADNAQSILGLANAMGELSSEILKFLNTNPQLALGILGALAGGRIGGLPGAAIGAVGGATIGNKLALNQAYANIQKEAVPLLKHNLQKEAAVLRAQRTAGKVDPKQVAKVERLTAKLNAATGHTPTPTIGGGDISQFLAPGGGGGNKTHRGPVDHSARDANQFDQEIRRANIDILNAKRDLATDEIERYQISIDIKDAEKAAFEAQLKYEVAAGEKSKAEADQLRAAYDAKDSLERQALIAEESERARKASAEIDMNFLQMEQDRLQSQSRLAETAEEQRAVQLRILDNAYAIERAQLNELIASRDATEAQKEIARQRLLNLNRTYGTDRQSVINGTRGPLEDYLASLPTTAAKANEAFQRLEVQGFEGLIDAALALSDGFDNAKDALLNTLKEFLLGLARMELQKGLAGLFGSAGGAGGFLGSIGKLFGGSSGGLGQSIYPVANGVDPLAPLPGFATGGLVKVLGRGGMDRNVVSINGIPQFRVSYGEKLGISNDNGGMMRGGGARAGWSGDMHVHGVEDVGGFRRNENQIVRSLNRRLGRAP